MKREKDDRYRRFYTESDISSDNNIPVSTDFFHLYPDAAEAAEDLLSSCREFRPLEQHARRFVAAKQKRQNTKKISSGFKQLLEAFAPQWFNQQNLPERELQAIQQQLDLFLQSGNLITSKELSKKIKSNLSALDGPNESTSDIQVLGIPTCNRNTLLVRCIRSYLSTSAKGSGIPHLHIVDDSGKSDQDNQNRQTIKDLCRLYETNLLWIDKSYRATFVKQLSQLADIPEKVTQFALFGDRRINFTAGASRNTLLLLAAGSKSVQVDDDTINEILPAPGIKDELALSTEESHEFLFFPDKKAVTEFAKQHKDNISNPVNNFFTLHNSLLGKHPRVLVQNENKIHYDRLIQNKFLKTIHQQDTHIAVTFLGALGDSGMNYHWQRLALNNHSHQQLVENESSYNEFICTRQLFRFVPQCTIGDTSHCMGMNMGLNTQRLLPPFMPVLRNEDGIFGALLHRYFPNTCKGHIAYAIRHDPPGRNFALNKEEALRVGSLCTNDIMVAVLLGLSEQVVETGDDCARNLEALGKYINSLGEVSSKAFQDEVSDYCSTLLSIRMKFIQQLLNERTDAPDYWKRDAKQVIANFRSLLNSVELCVPSDLPGNVTERRELLQELFKKYGTLLLFWPTIWEAALSIQHN